MHTRSLACIVSAIVVATGSAQDRVGDGAAGPENPLGWSWKLEPTALPEWDWTAAGFTRFVSDGLVTIDETRDGRLRVRYTHTAPDAPYGHRPSYRACIIDADGQRRVSSSSGMSSNAVLTSHHFLFGTERYPQGEPLRIGIEVLTDAGRKLISERAIEAARAAGVQVLPFPELDRPYRFELTTMAGRTIRTEDLRGRVVLLDHWATWCGPCMAKMPELKVVYEKWQNAGLVIIGINYDQSPGRAREAIAEQGLPWIHVKAPTDEAQLELFEQACGLSSLPRLFLLDRDGVLREDFYPMDLGEHIRPLVEAGASGPAGEP